jgi:hypothetical protein
MLRIWQRSADKLNLKRRIDTEISCLFIREMNEVNSGTAARDGSHKWILVLKY